MKQCHRILKTKCHATNVTGTFNPAMVGLALVYCLQLMGLGSWTMMLFVQVTFNRTSYHCSAATQVPSVMNGKLSIIFSISSLVIFSMG